jgi:uncharacterized protein YjbI with pentapeptide repeats
MADTRLLPQRAPVRPRITAAPHTVPRPLDVEVADLLARGTGAVRLLVGPARSGKTTALRHLAAVFAGESRLRLVDSDAPAIPPDHQAVTIAAVRGSAIAPAGDTWFLAPWSDDDCLDYLMHVHAGSVAAAYDVWRAPGPAHDLHRWPQLCAAVLDEIALGGTRTVFAALRAVVHARVAPAVLPAARDHALRTFLCSAAEERADADARERHVPAVVSALDLPLRRSLAVRSLLAAERLAAMAAGQEPRELPRVHWHSSLRSACGQLLREDGELRARLLAALSPRRHRHRSLLLSLLCNEGPAFRPPLNPLWGIAGARLAGADLCGLQLLGNLDGIDLADADLRRSRFVDCTLVAASLRGAKIAEATLIGAQATHLDASGAAGKGLVAERAVLTDARFADADLLRARFAHAILCRADFARANLRGADLQGADLTRAVLAGADLAGANLAGADLSHTDLRDVGLAGCRLERTRAIEADLSGVAIDLDAAGADLRRADLTGSAFRGANLRGADMRGAALAGIDLQGADLADADMRRATFQPGSARSGLVRKADLRGCNLRGARITGVDFHLVDVRGAQIDAGQRAWLERCRAILDRQAGA